LKKQLLALAKEFHQCGVRTQKLASETSTLDSYVMTPAETDRVEKDYWATLQVANILSSGASYYSADNEVVRMYNTTISGKPSSLFYHHTMLGSVKLNLLYEAVLEYQQKIFQKVTSFSISFDLWSVKSQRMAFIGLNYSFLDDSLQMCDIALHMIPMHERHTAIAIAKEIAKAIDADTTDRQLLHSVVSDHASNALKSSKLLLKNMSDLLSENTLEIEESDEEVDGQIGCIAHALALVVKDALNSIESKFIKNCIDRVSAIGNATRRSNPRVILLHHVQELSGLPLKLPLKYVPTRWNSLFESLCRFVEIQREVKICFALGAFNDSTEESEDGILKPLSQQEFEVLKSCLDPLRILSSFTKFVQGDKFFVTAHVVRFIRECQQKFEEFVSPTNTRTTPTASTFCLKLSHFFDIRMAKYLKCESPTFLASLFHPMHAHQWDTLNSVERPVVQTTLISWMKNLVQPMQASSSSQRDPWNGTDSDVSSSPDNVMVDPEKFVAHELRNLVRSLSLYAVAHKDLLVWDAEHPNKMDDALRRFYLHPECKQIWRDFLRLVLCAATSSSATERLFSRSGLAFSILRQSMNEKTLAQETIVGYFLQKMSKNPEAVTAFFTFLKSFVQRKVLERRKTSQQK